MMKSVSAGTLHRDQQRIERHSHFLTVLRTKATSAIGVAATAAFMGCSTATSKPITYQQPPSISDSYSKEAKADKSGEIVVQHNCVLNLYNQQEIVNFIGSFKELSVAVRAVRPLDHRDIGLGALLNGYTKHGYWYQAGLVYNWQPFGGAFKFYYGVYVNKKDAYIVNVEDFGGEQVRQGDLVVLSLGFSKNKVVLKGYDITTHAIATGALGAYGAHRFIGSVGSAMPTGVMTEEHHTGIKLAKQPHMIYSLLRPASISRAELSFAHFNHDDRCQTVDNGTESQVYAIDGSTQAVRYTYSGDKQVMILGIGNDFVTSSGD